MCCKKTMEVLEKFYWLFLDFIVYVIMWLLFILLILGVFVRTMIDRFIYSFFGALDNIWNFLSAPKCKCKKNNKGDKYDR